MFLQLFPMHNMNMKYHNRSTQSPSDYNSLMILLTHRQECRVLNIMLVIIRDWSLIMGRGGTKREAGGM